MRLIGEGGDNNTVNRPVHMSETRLARAGGAPGNSGDTSANLAASQVHALEHRTHSAAGHGGGRTASSSVARDGAGATAYRHITQEQLLTDTLLRSAGSSLARDEAGATALTSTSAVVQLVHGVSSTAYYESEASYTPRVNLDRSEDVIDPHSARAPSTPHRGIYLSLSLARSLALSLSYLFSPVDGDTRDAVCSSWVCCEHSSTGAIHTASPRPTSQSCFAHAHEAGRGYRGSDELEDASHASELAQLGIHPIRPHIAAGCVSLHNTLTHAQSHTLTHTSVEYVSKHHSKRGNPLDA